jgi:hypothetical protein
MVSSGQRRSCSAFSERAASFGTNIRARRKIPSRVAYESVAALLSTVFNTIACSLSAAPSFRPVNQPPPPAEGSAAVGRCSDRQYRPNRLGNNQPSSTRSLPRKNKCHRLHRGNARSDAVSRRRRLPVPHCSSYSRSCVRLSSSSPPIAVSTDAPLHVSDDGLATLIHVHMLDPDSLRAAVPQAA